jgi:[glutamine synthetase] adenylyltransferase / [glutamine synthetase]-adenylyl-L-tyrosine phosphorylase
MPNPPGFERPGPLARCALRLARLGFTRSDEAAQLLTEEPLLLWNVETNAAVDDGAAAIVAALGRAANPDEALAALARLAEALGSRGTLRASLSVDAALRARLLGALGASLELGAYLFHYPTAWVALAGAAQIDPAGSWRSMAASVGADVHDPVTGSGGTAARLTGREASSALRAAYRRQMLAIAGRDLAGELSVEEVTAALTELAGATLQAALAVAAAETRTQSGGGPEFELAVIAMGKTGGRELNYVSDVDVIFVAEPARLDTAEPARSQTAEPARSETAEPAGETSVEEALTAAAALASRMMRLCAQAVWPVDAALRPEGKDGPLVRTLASHVAYYQRWASTWEFQALLKARPIAGDVALGQRYVDAVAPFIWTAADRPDFVADVQAMRRRVVAHVPAAVAEREIKLGPGGLRDVEFAVQLLQLVHGRADESLRAQGTLPALNALRDGGFIGRDDAVSLADAYRFLRAVEHRLQLARLRRTHTVPEDPLEVSRLARAMGFRADGRGDATAVWRSEWDLHAREVRRLHEKLFYRPLLEAVARVPGAGLRLSPAEAQRRLAALGFVHPDRALQHIDALTAGLSRRAAIQRTLLPVLLAEFSDSPDPDAGLLRYRRVSDTAHNAPWYLRTLRDEGRVVDRLAFLLGTSKYVADLLTAAPDALQVLSGDEDIRLQSRAQLGVAMRDSAARQDGFDAAVRSIRAVRRTELVRIAAADLLGQTADGDEVAQSLSATMDATVSIALDLAMSSITSEHGWAAPPARMAMIAMGRLGGHELGYGSDADVLFVYEVAGTGGPGSTADEERAARFAQEVARRLRASLSAPGGDPPVEVDANLRPEGRDGPLARSLASYAAYYRRWSSGWEAQALLRARPFAGDGDLGRRFCALIEPLRYPAEGLSPEAVLEIRRLKARIDSERLPRGADPATHTKLGRGGLGDVEWTAQLLQLRHAGQVEAMRTTGTVEALRAASAAGLIDEADARTLIRSWRMATRTRNAIMLVRGKADDQLPAPGPALIAVGRALGYASDFEPGQLDNDYRRTARRARAVVDRVFYAD